MFKGLGSAMRIGFIVGEVEQHQMELSFDQKSGDLRILMDGRQVLEDTPKLSGTHIKMYELQVGQAEKHKLALLFGYGDEPEARRTPRMSLMVTPMEEEVIDPLAVRGSDSVFAPSTPAASQAV